MRTMMNQRNGKQGMATARMMGMRASWLGMALAGVLAFMLLPSPAKGFLMGQGFTYTPVINPVISSGHVMARAQVVGPNGGPILVKVRSSGAGGQSSTVEVEEIGEAYAGGPLEGVYVLSGSAYRDVLRQLAQLRARYPERMARAEFLPAQQLASGLSLADGSSSPGVTLPDHIKTVVVWGRQDRLSPETDAHILLSVPFQLDAGTSLAEDVSSLLMNPDGSIRSLAHGSGVGGDSFDVESFTWRTAFYAQPGSTEQSDRRVDRNEDTIFGPISNAILEQIGWFGTMYAATDADGYYFINSPMLCMRNSYGGYLLPGMDTNLILTVPTVPFNPNRLGIPPYFEIRDIYAGCSDSFYPYRINFMIDVLWLVGELHLSNTPGGAAIPVGSNVSYEGQDRSGEPTVRVWDYDGDGEPDTAILANKVTVTDPETGESFIIAEPASDGPYQAVYFSSGTRDQNAEQLADRVPDLWRLADRSLDGRPTGLLTEISEDALRHTDVYIFRESTGELLVEVSGLPEGPYAGRASRIENNAYLWHTLLRGRGSVLNNFAAYGTSSGSRSPTNEDAFRERSEELGFSSRYQSRDADMPSPGEMLHVVAINRVTGYTGSVRFELGAANSPGGAQQRVPHLELLPPNVRVWAQRLTEIEAGLTAGEQREYLISHEGAHTASDLIVGLYTEWRAADGSPLPNALGQVRGADFGLTGRLAKVRDGQLVPVTAGQALDSSNTLEDALASGSQGAVAEFPIGPGQNLQLLRLPNTETGGNEHYYVNLFGRALNKEVCSHCQYDQAGLHPTLAGRPNHFAPVFVPRYDQARTDALRLAARELAEQGEEGEEAIKVDAQYIWMLRPEYQFSQIDFRIDELGAVRVEGDGSESIHNLLDSKSPIITSGDALLRALYGLTLPGSSPLSGIDGAREYVLAFGEDEIGITIADGKILEITNMEQFVRLSVEDFLSLRIYLNHDPSNVLWEWAFGRFALMPEDNPSLPQDKRVIQISADDAYARPEFINGLLFRGDQGEPDFAPVRWRVVGGGHISPSIDYRDDGLYEAELNLPVIAGERAWVEASVDNDAARVVRSAVFEIMPGKAHEVEIQLSGETVVGSLGEVVIDLSVKDQFGNKVADGTPIEVSADGMLIKERTLLHEGSARIVLSALDDAGIIPVTMKIDDKEIIEDVYVHDLQLDLLVPQDLRTGQEGQVTVKGESSYGDLEGLQVHMAAHRGRLDDYYITLGAGGTSTVRYAPGEYPGFAQISAKVGSRIASTQLLIDDPEGGARFTKNELVVDGHGSIEFDNATLHYGPSTDLLVPGQEGEYVSASLIVDHAPPLYPLLDYSAEFRGRGSYSGEGEIVIDYSSGIDATGVGVVREVVDNKPWRAAWRVSEEGRIDIPRHALVTALRAPGITLSVNLLKLPDSESELLDFDAQGFRLSVTPLGGVKVHYRDEGGEQSASAGFMVPGAWSNLAVHYYDGVLRVAIDGQRMSIQTEGRPESGNDAFGLRVASGVALDVARLKIYDWTREQKISFSGGELEGQGLVGPDGYARMGFTAHAPRFAYQQMHRRVEYASSPMSYIFPAAYASALSDWRQCGATIARPSEDDDDPLIAEAERFFQIMLDCIVKPQVDEAIVEYETAEGFGRKALLLVKKTAYEGMYTALKSQARNAINIANCLDAVITGDNSSAVGMGCDFITGLLAIGDLRDLVIQGYNYFFSKDDYDSTVVVLSSLGALATLSSPTGGGAILNVGVSATKTLAKALRRLGPEGRRTLKVIVDYLDSNVVSAPDMARKMAAIQKMAPFLQVAALVTLEREMLMLLIQSIESTDDLLVWIGYLGGYFERLGGELLGQSSPTMAPSWLVEEAHASTGSRAARQFLEAMRRVSAPPPADRATVARSLTKAMAAIDANPRGVDDFLSPLMKNDAETIRAFQRVHEALGEGATRNFRGHYGLSLGDGFSVQDFLKEVGDFDLVKLIADAGSKGDDVRHGLNQVFAAMNYQGRGFNASQGASHHLLVLSRLSKTLEGNVKIVGVEAPHRINSRLNPRRYDIELSDGTLIDAKAWRPDDIQRRLRDSMSFKAADGLAPDQAGQLFKDLVGLHGNMKIQWHFDPRARGMEAEIVREIRALVDANKDAIGKVIGARVVDDIDIAVADIKSKVSSMIVIQEYGL